MAMRSTDGEATGPLPRTADWADEVTPVPSPGRLPLLGEEQVRRLAEVGIDAGEVRYLDSAVQNAAEGIAVLVPAGPQSYNVAFVNEAFVRLTGRSREAVLGRPPHLIGIREADRTVVDALQHPLCRRRGFDGEAMAQRADGSHYVLDLAIVPVHGGNGEVSYWIAYLHDVSTRTAQLRSLEHRALHDLLTDLPNRVLLQDRLEQAIVAAAGEKTMAVGLLVFDLDGFKEVNDTLGHRFGDEVLRRVSARVKPHLRPVDTLARLGGDEFGVLLTHINQLKDAMRVAEAVHDAFLDPFDIEGQTFECGASVGVALFPSHGTASSSLLRCAEVAMYAAKASRNGYLAYTPEQETASAGSLSLRVDLREGIDQGQLVLYYQPKLHLVSGRVTQVEALVRWRHPQRGLLSPDQFIPLAERTALIKALTDWVLNGALSQCKEWRDRGLPLQVSVNLPTQSLLEPFLPQRISRLLEKWGLPPGVLKLEITESGLMADPPHVLAILHLLRTLGVRLSLDDFGTGYSSLVHMRNLPVDEIKVDKSFVMGMRVNESDAAIVKAIIGLAHSLGHEVVAEGVDDVETLRRLTEMGCDLAQGYHLSPPLPADRFQEWLSWMELGRQEGTGTPDEGL